MSIPSVLTLSLLDGDCFPSGGTARKRQALDRAEQE